MIPQPDVDCCATPARRDTQGDYQIELIVVVLFFGAFTCIAVGVARVLPSFIHLLGLGFWVLTFGFVAPLAQTLSECAGSSVRAQVIHNDDRLTISKGGVGCLVSPSNSLPDSVAESRYSTQ